MKKAVLLCCLLTVLTLSQAKATTLDFEFTGYQETISLYLSDFGSFSFADGLTTVNLADLTAFSMTETSRCCEGLPSVYTSEDDLSNVSAFHLVLTGGVPTTFDLTVQGNGSGLRVGAQGLPDTVVNGAFIGIGGVAAEGPGAFVVVPEPASTGFLLGGSICVLVARRKRAWIFTPSAFRNSESRAE